MGNTHDQIKQLEKKLSLLLKKHEAFADEIKEIQQQIHQIKSYKTGRGISEETIDENQSATEAKEKDNFKSNDRLINREKIAEAPSKIKSDLEKFIGENLINKIGIAITVIGVGIGAKYVIENELITPLTRIISGYLTGLVFLGFATKLREKYDNFSAVLLSGSMAIMYFITYAAYSFYGLIPQALTYTLMVLLTAFTALAAIRYDKQVIAHMGLVGAYAVPFLLSNGSGNAGTLFIYMSIINVGILIIAFKKYWNSLYYASFLLSWVIYFRWFFSFYNAADFYIAFIFAGIFFLIFYVIFLEYKLFQETDLKTEDILFILTNSFFFYGIGYTILARDPSGEQFLGLFTLTNAAFHSIISVIIYRNEKSDRKLLDLIAGLALIFITLAIPVQLDGNWITLLWAFEAALLFWIGRTKDVPVCEKLSYPLMMLAFFSIMHDWRIAHYQYNPKLPKTRISPLLNIHFLTSLVFIACFGFINKLNYNRNFTPALHLKKDLQKLASFAMGGILLFVLYYSFEAEIASYWNQLYADSQVAGKPVIWNKNLLRFKTVWVINYTLLFLTALSTTNIYKLKSKKLGLINLGLNILAVAAFFTIGLHVLGKLRASYLNQTLSGYYQIGWFNIGIRYVSLGFVAMLIIACYKYVQQHLFDRDFTMTFDILLHICILWTLSSELINWLNFYGSTQSYKLGLSILWGCYSLLLIVLGIQKNKKHLRIEAIFLFGITLIKLFSYDIATLGTISKTVLFVSLGILLLIISFLYNKYKHLITDQTND